MTCEELDEFKEIRSIEMATVAELKAVKDHVLSCDECLNKSIKRIREIRSVLSADVLTQASFTALEALEKLNKYESFDKEI